MPTSGFGVRIDDQDVRELVERFDEPGVKKIIRSATTKAGTAMRKVLDPAIPVGPTGNLRRSNKSRRIRSNPAIGVVVGPMGRLASHRHLVIGGTKPHLIKPKPPHRSLVTPFGSFGTIHHPGARPNDWLSRVDGAAFDKGQAAADKVLDKALE